MGSAWCRHRAERARDPKSPLDRVIVRCVDKFYSVDSSASPVRIPKPPPGGAVPSGAGAGGDGVGDDIVPVHSSRREGAVPTHLATNAGAWQKVSLQVPQQKSSASPSSAAATPVAFADDPPTRTPVPPPRRKRQAKKQARAPRTLPPRPPPASAAPKSPIVQLLTPPKPRPKNTSTVSLPEWRELSREASAAPAQPPRPASASPRPRPHYLRPPSLSSVSESTLERVETYLRRCRSFGSMPTGELVDKLSSIDADSDGEGDPWEGVEDFDHVFQPVKGSPPHTPKSRLEGKRRRSGANTPTPVNVTEMSTSTPNSAPPAENGIVLGRFVVQSTEDEWFNSDYRRDEVPATKKDTEEDLTEVKKELQSIIYDYNRTKKISTSSMEVLPTQPVRSPKKKKISVTSITPPPSPAASDQEDDEAHSVPATAIINGESTADANTHSTLLRLLRGCQNIEGALEEIDINDMPHVQSALRSLSENNRHLKETSKHTLCSLDSGLDVRGGSLERSQEPPKSEASVAKNIDSGVDDSDDHQGRHEKDSAASAIEPKPGSPGDAATTVVRRRLEPRSEDDGGSSSGRSSMTPSLSELEAALSDMLEKSAAAGEDDRASPLPAERVQAAAAAVAAATAAAAAAGATASDCAVAAENPPAQRSIPQISVTQEKTNTVH